MKLLKLLTATAVGAVIATSVAAADTMEIYFNDKIFEVDATIVSDRTMIKPSSLEKLGISVAETDGVWEFSKHGNMVGYDSKTKLYQDIEGEFDVMPIVTEDEQLIPLRTLAENLDLAVGWDGYASKVVLIDLKDYLAELEQTSPEFYKFLNVKMKSPTVGVGSGELLLNIDAKEADEPGQLKLKIVQKSSMLDDMGETNLTLEEFLFENEEGRYALEDLTVDGIYDIEAGVIYFKTNAVEKIEAYIPEDQKAQLSPVLNMFTADTWYKFDYNEYMSAMMERMGAEYAFSTVAAQMQEGITFGEIFNMSLPADYYIDDIYAFEYITELSKVFRIMMDNKVFGVESLGNGREKIFINMNVDNLVDSLATMAEQEEAITEAEIEEAKTEFKEMFGEGCMVSSEIELADAIPVKANVEVKFMADNVNFDLQLNSSLDTNVTPEEITPPASALNIMTVIESMTNYVQ